MDNDRRFLEGPNGTMGDSGLDCMDTENNPGELTISLRNINRMMETKGWSYERAVYRFGIKGHPYFADFWPETKYWGDARIARRELGLPLDD